MRPLSFATVGSNLLDGYYPGRFGLLTYGIHWELSASLGCFFSGLGYHGGTAPISPTTEVADWATRALIIAYAPCRVVNGSSRFSVAAWPARSLTNLVVFSQEIMNPLYVS